MPTAHPSVPPAGFRTRLTREIRARTDLWRYLARLRNFPRFWPQRRVRKRIDGVVIELTMELDPMEFGMYLGLYERPTIRAMKGFLRPGDTVIDVGANLGYLSAVAASLVGPTGQVYSFEPVPQYFQRLQRLAQLNPAYRIVPVQAAAGEKGGTAVIRTSITSIGANTIIPGHGVEEEVADTMEVPVVRLDAWIRDASLSRIALIKIDTEGFEFPVLRGLQEFFETVEAPPPIIVEIHPEAYPLLGYTLFDLAEYMGRYGYRAYRLDARGRDPVDVTAVRGVRDLVFVAATER